MYSQNTTTVNASTNNTVVVSSKHFYDLAGTKEEAARQRRKDADEQLADIRQKIQAMIEEADKNWLFEQEEAAKEELERVELLGYAKEAERIEAMQAEAARQQQRAELMQSTLADKARRTAANQVKRANNNYSATTSLPSFSNLNNGNGYVEAKAKTIDTVEVAVVSQIHEASAEVEVVPIEDVEVSPKSAEAPDYLTAFIKNYEVLNNDSPDEEWRTLHQSITTNLLANKSISTASIDVIWKECDVAFESAQELATKRNSNSPQSSSAPF